MTKEQLRRSADRYLQMAKQGDCPDIHAAYGRPSALKVAAYHKICNAVNIMPWHTPVTVMAHSCHYFSVAYCYIIAVDGVDVAYFMYRTAKNTYKLRLNPDEVQLVESLCV